MMNSKRAGVAAVALALVLPMCAMAAATDYAAITAWLAKNVDAPADGLPPGTYGRDRLPDLARYLPPGYLEEFDFPGLAFELTATRHYVPHEVYRAATAKFVDKSTIAPDGNLEGYVAGQPFSEKAIDAAPPDKAGYMVAWNQIHRWQYYGYQNGAVVSFIKPTPEDKPGTLLPGMLGGGTVDRSITMFYHRVYLSGLAMLPDHDYRMDVDGSDKLLFKEYIELQAPFDVAGTKLVVERPLDQSEGDQVNSYLPSERRVRRLSAKERADSWLGSNWTLDDFEGYSGLVMDNTWKFIGRKVVPHVASSEHLPPQFYGPESVIPHDRWQLRPCWVVEAVPKWDGHPYGRRLLFIDRETYSVAMTLVFDRQDRLFKIMTTMYSHSDELANPPPALSTPRWRASIVVNVQDRTANIATEIKSSPTEFVKVKPSTVRNLFSVSNLTTGR